MTTSNKDLRPSDNPYMTIKQVRSWEVCFEDNHNDKQWISGAVVTKDIQDNCMVAGTPPLYQNIFSLWIYKFLNKK